MLHIERSGEGEPVLFLHGAASSSRTYGWLPDLGRTVVRMDFRGHGRSDRSDSYLLGDFVDDALSVLREVGPAAVVGHSLGGVVAWTLGQRVPQLVTGLVLEDPPLYLGEPEEVAGNPAAPYFLAMRDAAARWQAEGTTLEEATAALDAQDPDRLTADGANATRAYALLHLDPPVIDALVDGTMLAPADTTSPMTVPAFILAAGVVPAFPIRHEERLARTHPDVVVQRVEGATHVIHDQRASREQYLRALRERL